jgi:flagellar biosynthesis/type III secretory pathway protein FliH
MGRADGLARLAAHAAHLREREARADAASLDRTVDLARLLAERLLCRALELTPGEITALARRSLAEAGGARRVRLFAHPADATLLRAATSAFDSDGRVIAIIDDSALTRGDVRLETDVGVVDARLRGSLARLADRLREALTP